MTTIEAIACKLISEYASSISCPATEWALQVSQNADFADYQDFSEEVSSEEFRTWLRDTQGYDKHTARLVNIEIENAVKLAMSVVLYRREGHPAEIVGENFGTIYDNTLGTQIVLAEKQVRNAYAYNIAIK
jgi:hypothetical protein